MYWNELSRFKASQNDFDPVISRERDRVESFWSELHHIVIPSTKSSHELALLNRYYADLLRLSRKRGRLAILAAANDNLGSVLFT